ncbi:MAG: sigma-70 family RNA polymerase sigma factor [Bacteroidetes bacterium]|nr:sigma-70 family RNA polymerase sigma factor [Bacteroidota bacterium]HET6245062.1 sigma-70 family RNA polymerase sigma factor [Bacteroidia bacterium]
MLKNKKTYSEQELVDLLKKKDKEAFSYLYDKYSGALFGVVIKILSDQELAEDVLQEAFVKIWQAMESYDAKKGSLFTWMLNIARNKSIDKLRSKKTRPEIQDIDQSVYTIDKSQNHQNNIQTIGMREVVNKLGPEYQKVIHAIYFSGYTHEEASKELNIPLGTVKTRVRAALKELRKLFN